MEESRGMRVGKGERDGWEMAAPGGSQLRWRKAVGKRGDGGLLHPPPRSDTAHPPAGLHPALPPSTPRRALTAPGSPARSLTRAPGDSQAAESHFGLTCTVSS